MLLKYHSKVSPKINIKRDNNQEAQACSIPLTPIWPAHYSQWNPQSSVYDCSYEKNLTDLKENRIVKLFPAMNDSCCLREVIRGAKDSSYHLTKCTPLINDTEDVTDREVLLVKCGNSTNFHANIPIKPRVQEKLNYWEEISDEEKPFNVFILGIDTVSRSHAYRSLPKTMKLMKELDFIDFQAYHSTSASTLTNLMAILTILMGLRRDKVRQTCAKNWQTPFDKCPLIWKNFSKNNYVTAYVEDGLQSFNWGGQSGFVNQPTDYYLHHLFLSLDDSRRHFTKKFGNKYYSKCTSQETVPEFLLRYMVHWQQNFSKIPHFFLSWFAYPFHEDIYFLANFDEHLTRFFKFLKSQESLLRKSVVIFVSDHGDRTSSLYPKSIESYFERGLPIFQIRLPDQLKENYPDIVEAIQSNSRKLTTPFDIHHTLLHVQSLNSNLDLVSKNFEPEGKDRCSLFVKVPSNRTCASTNILKNCLCYTQYDSSDKDNAQSISRGLAKKLLKFSVSHLNAKVLNSSYGNVCMKWNSSSADIIYARYVSETEEYKDVVMVFQVYHGKAKFEARLKIKKSVNKSVVSKITEVAEFSRINIFGNQSWCVRMVTDVDKEMKKFCVCKNQRGQLT